MQRILILLSLGLLLFSCRKESEQHSEIFTKIVGETPEEGFRKVELGLPMQAILQTETAELVRQDNFGLVYKIDIGSGREARLEYFQHTYSSQTSDTVVSIISNVVLRNEVEANGLYRELETWLTELYGLADGKLGAYQWAAMREGEGSVAVNLRLDGEKEQISLNFYRPDEFYEKYQAL